mgnify:CR=1 FL=1
MSVMHLRHHVLICVLHEDFQKEKFTLCMTHSLNDENGISSACEYDINSVIGKVIMTNLSGKAPYMGNTNAIAF